LRSNITEDYVCFVAVWIKCDPFLGRMLYADSIRSYLFSTLPKELFPHSFIVIGAEKMVYCVE